MATNTFQGVVRSFGGNQSKATYPGVMPMVARFHIPDPTAANTTAVQVSSTDTRAVVLPTNAVVLQIIVNAAATGGTNPTFDMGWIGVSEATALDVDGLIAEGDADAGKSVFEYSTATSGDDLGTTMSTTQPVRVTGGVGASAATGGTLTGYILYTILDSAEVS